MFLEAINNTMTALTDNNDTKNMETTSTEVVPMSLWCNRKQRDETHDTSTSDSSTTTTSTVESAYSYAEPELHHALADFSMNMLILQDKDLLERKIDWMLTENPNSVHEYDRHGLTPLHVACREGVSLEVIHKLVQVWPDSVKTPTLNKSQMLPLHMACRYYAGVARHKVILFLLRTFPQAAEIPTSKRDYALHLACKNYFTGLETIKLLEQANPLAVRTANNKNQRPIHLVCEKQYMRRMGSRKSKKKHDQENNNNEENSDVSASIIRFLVRMDPHSLAERNGHNNELPLHAAIRGYQSIETIDFILSIYPESIRIVDSKGRTALHIAVTRTVPNIRIVQLLLERGDSTLLNIQDRRGKRPIDYVTNNPKVQAALSLLQQATTVMA